MIMIWCLTRMMYQCLLTQKTALAEITGVGVEVLKALLGSRDGVHLQALRTRAMNGAKTDTMNLEILITVDKESEMKTTERMIRIDHDH